MNKAAKVHTSGSPLPLLTERSVSTPQPDRSVNNAVLQNMKYLLKAAFLLLATLIASIGATSCHVRTSSKAISTIGSIDLPDELTKAMKSTVGNGGAGGSRNGTSAEGHGSFTGSEADAKKTIAALYYAIGSRVGTKEIGGGHDGDANDGTLEAAHWIYQDRGMEGAIRIRLIQIGENRWTIVAFLHEA